MPQRFPCHQPRTPRLAIAGSGAQYLIKDKRWMRGLLRLVKAYDREQVGPHAVADHLAKLNDDVCRQVSDKSVGPRCIVAWRNSKGGVHRGGGAQQFYTGTTRDDSSPAIPIIGAGMDIRAISGVMMQRMIKMMDAQRSGQPFKDLSEDEIKAAYARLPSEPDENLR